MSQSDYESDLKALEGVYSPLKNPPKPIDKSVKRDMMEIKVMKEEIKGLTERLDVVERLLQKYMKTTKNASYNIKETKPNKKVSNGNHSK